MHLTRLKRRVVLATALLLVLTFLLPFAGAVEAHPIDDCVAAGGMHLCFPDKMMGKPGYSINGASCKPRPWPFLELCP